MPHRRASVAVLLGAAGGAEGADGAGAHRAGHNLEAVLADLQKRMVKAAADLEFEDAARLRDEIRRLEAVELGLDRPGVSFKAATAAGAALSGSAARKAPRKKKQRR